MNNALPGQDDVLPAQHDAPPAENNALPAQNDINNVGQDNVENLPVANNNDNIAANNPVDPAIENNLENPPVGQNPHNFNGNNQNAAFNGAHNTMGGFGLGSLFGFFNQPKTNDPIIEKPEIDDSKTRHLEQFAEQSNSSAEYFKLGSLYYLGDKKLGIEPNLDLSFYYYKQAAIRGHTLAMYNLGILVKDQDETLAYKYFMECAENNLTI